VNLVEIGFVVLMFIDCFKNCKKDRLVWLILIPLGRILFEFKSGTIQGFGINIFFGYTSYVTNIFGENRLGIMIPVAAVVWVFLRNRFCTLAESETDNKKKNAKK